MLANIKNKITEATSDLAVVKGKVVEVKGILSVVKGKIVEVWANVRGAIFCGMVQFYNNDVGNDQAELDAWSIADNGTATKIQDSGALGFYQSSFVLISGNGEYIYAEDVSEVSSSAPFKGSLALFKFNKVTNNYELVSNPSATNRLATIATDAIGKNVVPWNNPKTGISDCGPTSGAFSYNGQYLAHLMKYPNASGTTVAGMFIFKNTGTSFEYYKHIELSVGNIANNVYRVSFSDDLSVFVVPTYKSYHIYQATSDFNYIKVAEKSVSGEMYSSCRVSPDGQYIIYNTAMNTSTLMRLDRGTLTQVANLSGSIRYNGSTDSGDLLHDVIAYIEGTNEFLYASEADNCLHIGTLTGTAYTQTKTISTVYQLNGMTRDGQFIAYNGDGSSYTSVYIGKVSRGSDGVISALNGSKSSGTSAGGDYTFRLIG